MKKVLLTLLVVVMGLTAFSQSQSRIITLHPAYPIAIGETATDSLTYSNSGIYVYDIIQDNLPTYEIGYIYDKTVDYTEAGLGFYVKADSLHSNNVVYSISVDSLPIGPIEFNGNTGRFKYFPASEDYRTFHVTFTATNGTDTVSEIVKFVISPQVVPEQYSINNKGVFPYGEDYTLVASSDSVMHLNGSQWSGGPRNVHSYSISGKDIVFDNDVQNKVWGLSGREDIYELNIYAEKLTIRSALRFPQTNVTIYAKEVWFEDQNGVVSSINTTPTWLDIRTDGVGANGDNAGNIQFYVRDFHSDAAKRFILNGGSGQSTNRNGTPGNGGDGGTITSNLDISAFCDFARGSCGVRYDADSNSGDHYGSIIASGNIGNAGHFEIDYTPYKYINPAYIAPVIRHLTDAYINNFIVYSIETCREYSQLIDAALAAMGCDTCMNAESMELSSELMEFSSLLNSLELGLDYFGNPIGWVPLLSFEVMLQNYQNEINRAIPTLYLNYWLTKVDHTLQEWVEAKMTAANQQKTELNNLCTQINQLAADIPILLDNIDYISAKIVEVQSKIDRIEADLLRKAKKKLKKKAKIGKIAQMCKAVASVAQYCGPYGAAISGAINTVTGYIETANNNASEINSIVSYASDKLNIDLPSWDTSYTNNFSSIYDTTYSLSEIYDSVKTQLNSINWSSLNSDDSNLSTAFNSIKNNITPVLSTIGNVRDALKKTSVPEGQVKALFEKLCAECQELNALKADMEALNNKKKQFREQLEEIYHTIPLLLSNVSVGIISLDAFRNDAFEANSKRDLHAMQYLEKMTQRAKNRLVKYHYYVRKAYEYRMLKSYEGEYNLVDMFERFEGLATTMDYDSIVDFTNYKTLASVFNDVISGIVEEIIDEYSYNYPEQSVPITIVVPREQLDIINNNEELKLNFYEMGIFSPDEDNVRIVDLSVHHIETHVEGNIGYTSYMDLNMTHQGISRFRKDGQIYWFDHISRNATSPHTWGVRYDAVADEVNPIQPSFASQSLLYSILTDPENPNAPGSGSMMLFSRPSAWADISISKKVHSTGGARIVVDSLVLRLQYDFMRRPTQLRNIDITTSDDLLPYIACSEADVNGRSNGNGNLNRSYNISNQPLTFTAIEQYGNWYFVNWTNRAGDTVSNVPSLTVNRTTDQFYRANYERRVPILDVPDTIFVSYDGGIYSINVANIGSGDVEMDWYVDDSISSWVHLTGTTEGIDSGMFSFICDVNESGIDRIDSIEIFAPETDVMAKMIYIVQVDNQGFSVSANVVPEGAGYVTGTGFYSSGDTVSLTAIAADSCHFVSWEQNGQVVSTQPNYTFVVNSDVLLTANFSCSEVSIQNTSESTIKIYPNPANHYVTIEGDNILSVRIYSLLGEEVMHHRNNGSSNVSLNLSRLSDGIYLIEVETPETVTHKKLIKHNN